MWDITEADRYRWQRVAINRLTNLLRVAPEYDLPALTWTVDPTGGLTGAVAGPDQSRRVAFDLWAATIGANRRTETPDPSGVTRLYAAAIDVFGRANVAITATLFPPDDTDAESGSDA